MKALSLWRPWSVLCVIGAKEYETRSWATNYRGELAIHSTKSIPKEVFERTVMEGNFSTLWTKAIRQHPRGHELLKAKGAVIGTVELVDVVPTGIIAEDLSRRELAFGDFGPWRYAWKLANPQPLDEPVPTRGKRGLWEWRP